MVENAREKLKKKNLDLIVANDVSKSGIGFGSDSNEVTIIDRRRRQARARLSKDEIAAIILDEVLEILKKKRKAEEDWASPPGRVENERYSDCRSCIPAFPPRPLPQEHQRRGLCRS